MAIVVAASVNDAFVPLGSLSAVALLFRVVGAGLPSLFAHIGADLATAFMIQDFQSKLIDYWCPYFLTLPAGLLFALAH